MITIKFSTVKDPSAGTAAPEAEQEEEQKQRIPLARIPLAWIPATLGIGLLIAGLYLKGRIGATHPHASPETPHVTVPVAAKPVATSSSAPSIAAPAPLPNPQPAPTAKQPTPEEPAAVQEPTQEPTNEPIEHPFVGPTFQEIEASKAGIPMITPHSGERYIQVGAFNEEATRRFVQRLQRENRQPHVASGPTPQILRVLIGPFEDPGKLAEEKQRLENEGVDTFIRKY